MAIKENYTSEEWRILEDAPYWVFMAVAQADGNIDSKEISAFKKVLQNYQEFNNELIKEVLISSGNKYSDSFNLDKSLMEKELQEVTKILEKKASYKDALNFKKTLIAIGIHVGNSSGGIFSSKFSSEEVEALKEIGLLLGVTESQLQQAPSIKDLINTIKK